jgi:metal-responsive CopG/Arc/MetJ family transcriptional regulator
MATNITTITLKIDKEFKKEVEDFATREDLDVSKVIRKAVKSYISGKSPINKKSATKKAG